jgi:ribosome-associated protein
LPSKRLLTGDHGVVDDDRWLRVTPSCRIDRDELDWRVSRAGGPGGQHANTSDTRVEVRLDVATSPSLGPRQRARLLERLGPVVRATAADSRSQARNRELALARLQARLAAGLKVDAPRRPTKPTRAAKRKRVDQKRRRGDVKRKRGRPGWDD